MMSTPIFSLESLRVKEQPSTTIPPSPIKPKSKHQLFIKGPIPYIWLSKANALGGSTGVIANGLWFYVGLKKSRRFKIDHQLDKLSGVSRQTRQSALIKLERAGLIRLTNKAGNYPTVEILQDD